METIKARPTTYKGIRMRSRLEAGYAAHLDALTWLDRSTWEYEPRAFANQDGQYLPDFVVNGNRFIEVKPDSETNLDGVLRRMHIIRDTHPDAVLFVEVGSWRNGTYEWDQKRSCSQEAPCADCRPRTLGPLQFDPDIQIAYNVEGDESGRGHNMRCPICCDRYTHLIGADPYLGGTDRNREAVRLKFYCETGHEFVINITNHKGDTVFTIR